MTSSSVTSATSSLSSSKLLVPIFSVTLFLSASLMFMVQPMAGKMMLPIVGGTPAAWVTAMAFFQISLLAGYFAAFMFSKLNAKTHALFLILFLALGLFMLPLKIGTEHMGIVGQVPSPIGVAKLLLFTISIPFIALSTVSSTIQRLFATTDHPDAKDPYFLYAASNLGSFVGLFSYPLFVEPFSGLSLQSVGWLVGYLGLIVFCFVCFLSVMKHSAQKDTQKKTAKKERTIDKKDDVNHGTVTWKRRLHWVALAFVPSSLMMGVTLHITTDVMSMPMIWVLPLGLYLLTFVIAFSKQEFITYRVMVTLQPLVITAIIIMMNVSKAQTGKVFLMHLVAFTIIALASHMTLMKKRPETKYLTEFYLFLSIGGALGGVLNAFLSPHLFDSQLEYPLVMAGSLLLNPYFREKITGCISTFVMIGMAFSILFALIAVNFPQLNGLNLILLITAATMFSFHSKSAFLFTIVIIGIGIVSDKVKGNILYQSRNFFGIVKIHEHTEPSTTKDMTEEEKKSQITMRYMSHGTTVHGIENRSISRVKKTNSSSYYGRPLRDITTAYSISDIAVIGLGTGTLACYEEGYRNVTFYEIDPDIIDIARDWFSYLEDCSKDKKGTIILGDGRLSLERQDKKYDLIVLDAFSSDSIPIHLLTLEAFKTYESVLNAEGIIALHISNRYFELKKVIAATAKKADLQHRTLFSVVSKEMREKDSTEKDSEWVVLARQDTDLTKLDILGWKNVIVKPDDMIWTDDYSNLLKTIKFFKGKKHAKKK